MPVSFTNLDVAQSLMKQKIQFEHFLKYSESILGHEAASGQSKI